MSDWEEFFKQFGDWRVMLGFYEMRESVTVEELYKAFKARWCYEGAAPESTVATEAEH
jgi:hypothetical protein